MQRIRQGAGSAETDRDDRVGECADEEANCAGVEEDLAVLVALHQIGNCIAGVLAVGGLGGVHLCIEVCNRIAGAGNSYQNLARFDKFMYL